MSSGVIKKPGRQPTRSEQLLLNPLIERRWTADETVVIHHVTEDTAYRLQLEIERRFQYDGKTFCKFERIWI